MSETIEFRKYDKIHAIGKEEVKDILAEPLADIVIQEKIDGGNFRFYFTKEGQIIFGSRGQQLTSNEGRDDNVAKAFRKVCEYVRKQVYSSGITDFTQFSPYIFYGEACFKHTITYDYANMPPFLGFDVFHREANTFCDYPRVEELFKGFNLELVPLIKICKAVEITKIDDTIVPLQKYALASAQDKKAEGIVLKRYGQQHMFAKYVRNEFKERNTEAFGGTPKYNKVDDSNNEEFLFKYVTNPRIEKTALKLIDTGKKLDMAMMGDLIRAVYLDICEEEHREILQSNWKLDLKELRRMIAPRCRAVLSQLITNNAFVEAQ